MSLEEKVDSLTQMLEQQNMLKKEILNFDDASNYLGLSKSNLYKKTSQNLIPHYKPEGKIIYFKREELDAWMLRNRQSTVDEIRENAANFKLNDRRSRS